MKNIEEVKCIQTITAHTSSVNSLLLLKDKRVASCSTDGIIRIYEPSNDYHCKKGFNDGIKSICQLDDGTIVSCSYSHSIMIGNYIIKNAHNFEINKVIALPNNRIASCSYEHTIKIWKSNPPYSDTPIRVLEGHSHWITSLLYIKEKDLMISGDWNDRILSLWNMSTYQCVTIIKGVKCFYPNSLYLIDKDRVIFGGSTFVYIVNIDKCVIEKTIEDKAFDSVYCFHKLRDNTILCGCEDGIFCFYDMNTGQYKITKNNHTERINALLFIDDNTFLSCSSDNTIKVWKY